MSGPFEHTRYSSHFDTESAVLDRPLLRWRVSWWTEKDPRRPALATFKRMASLHYWLLSKAKAISRARRMGIIEVVGHTESSAPTRKGGLVRVWRGVGRVTQ